MDQAEQDRLTERFRQLVREHLQDVPIHDAAILKYGDDPRVEPGELIARVTIETEGGTEDSKQAFDAFHDTHRAQVRALRGDLEHSGVALLEFTGSESGCEGPVAVIRMPVGRRPEAGVGALTPVMARLAPEDLETVDTLITAGIAANRAEAVRWALARIRERPAYGKLRERAREIEELKTQF
jgi:hypothetical protein